MLGLTEIRLPHIRREDKLRFVPHEKEIDAIINGLRVKPSSFLRLLKDTGARPVEACGLLDGYTLNCLTGV